MTSYPVRLLWAAAAVLAAPGRAAAEPPANVWERQERATVTGQRRDVPVGYSPELSRFLVLGGRTSWAEYRKPRPYDELAYDPAEGRWENRFPEGKDWGPRFGPCRAPAWKDERWHLRDAEGNVRPNWTVYGTFALGQLYDYDPDTKAFYFYAGGRTFRYDPAARRWADLAPQGGPQAELGGALLWGSMCYDRHNRRFVLFGGGNVRSERGDPGTWAYSPADNAWTRLEPGPQPPQRANSRLVYDPVAKKVLLFGGDQLDRLLADTWAFDVTSDRWEQRRPARGPAPRGGHALLWLPKARKVLLLGGYEYTSAVGYVERLYRPLPPEAWAYDTAADRWDLIRRFEPGAAPESPPNVFLSAAAGADDQVLVVADGTWLGRLDVSKPDAAGTEKFGVAPGTTARRGGPHDPAWFREGVPPPDREKVAAELKGLPANAWAVRPTPKLPRPNMDWGSAVFAPEADLILRFSGGHSAYSGTAPQVYDVEADRYSLPFAPEYPLEYVYSNDQVDGEWSFQGNPWMTGHTYKSTGYDPNLRCLVFAPRDYTYFFDPAAGKWSRSPQRNPYQPNFYVVTVCATPQGAVAWADGREGGPAGLWRLDAGTRVWGPLPLTGPLPAKGADQHGMAYDARRDRLLLFSGLGERKGDVAEYDLKTGRSRWLDAAGREKAAAPARETAYLPEWDAVLVGARVAGGDGQMLWLLYDCSGNAWFGADLGGAGPIGKGAFNNSMGLMYDPNRRLVWAVGQNSHVHVLRPDRKEAQLRKLE